LFSIFRKSTHTERYLHRRSCHPDSVFKGLVSCLKKRALAICSSSKVGSEVSHLRRTFISNGYSHSDLRFLRSDRTSESIRTERLNRVSLPFYPGLANKLKRIFKRADVDVVFRPITSLRNIVSRRRPACIPKRGIVYRIPCSSCDWSYVGETGRTLGDRLSEHRRAVRRFAVSSEVANHVTDSGHDMDWESALTLDSESHFRKRVFKEAWFSRKYDSGNRVFCELDDVWKSFFSLYPPYLFLFLRFSLVSLSPSLSVSLSLSLSLPSF